MPRSGGTLWALPFYSREAMRGGSLANGIAADYDLQTYGAAVGSDVTFGNGKYTLGGLLAAGRGSIQAGGSLFDTQNDADFVGGMVSMRWRPVEELELSAYGGLLHQKNDVRQNNIFGSTTNFDSTLYQGGINARYEQPVGNKGKRVASIEIGGDVQRFRQEGLEFKAAGQDVAHMGSAGTTTVFVPVTLGLRATLTFDNNSTLTLEGHLGQGTPHGGDGHGQQDGYERIDRIQIPAQLAHRQLKQHYWNGHAGQKLSQKCQRSALFCWQFTCIVGISR